jgi:hypothetical protein
VVCGVWCVMCDVWWVVCGGWWVVGGAFVSCVNAHRSMRYLKAARAAVASHFVQINFESLQLSVEEEWTHVVHVAGHIVVV